MALSKKLLVRIAIGVAIAIVAIFIIWKIRSRSTYVTSTLSTAVSGTTEATFYSNLATCQNVFTTTTLGSVTVFTDVSCGSDNKITATTLLPHPFVAGATPSRIYVQGVSSDGSTMSTTKGYNTTPGNPVSVSDYIDNHRFKYPSTDGTCSSNTSPRIVQFGYAWLSTNDSVNTANVVRTTCITSNVQIYMDNKCPWTSKTPTSADMTATATGGGVPWTTYQTYKDTNLAIINDAYANLVLTAPATATATEPSLTMIQAAREADYTGATRAYIQSVCPDYYAQTSGYNPGTTADASLPNSPYNAYQADLTTATLSGGATALLGSIGFNKNLVTKANILNWAKYASVTNAVQTTNGVYSGGGVFDGSDFLLKPSTLGTSLYNNSTGVTQSGSTAPASTTTFQGSKNWEIAQDVGPGTVTKYGPIAGSKDSAGTAITTTATLTMKS